MTDESVPTIALQAGDVIIDLSYGVTNPYAYVIVRISKSWFRRRKPYLVSNTFKCGQVVQQSESGPHWMPLSWAIMAIVGAYVTVSRPGVGVIWKGGQ